MPFVRPALSRRQRGVVLRLGLRNLYIVPTRFGLLWLAGVALLQLVAIQLASNGTLLLSFLLLGLMLLAMHLTHDNLKGLELHCETPPLAFAGELAIYPLLIRSPSERLRMRVGFLGEDSLELALLASGERSLALSWRPQRRGWQTPGVIQIETIAPLGLFVCWSRWAPERCQLIAPARTVGPVGMQSPSLLRQGQEEWQGLRPHRVGERLALVDWPSFARGRQLQTRLFGDLEQQPLLLQPAIGVALEPALEHLSHRIWQLHQRGESYGLTLPGLSIPPQRGLLHRDLCLAALAQA